ncbi:uncharacterized protein LOC118458448 [Anopheles albimanus]|uniref:uncharacterized protein LOC118458448 n=1 Tax=Anopheles albimanus TaxID=7167 RepID=UPI00163E5CAF|nr:uncharacterized protein LOC118458448 [Anopheles albimanus]
MAEFIAVRTIVLIALFTSYTWADWTAHEATVELLPNDIVPQHHMAKPLTSVITSPQKVIEGQVESFVDSLRRSLEEVRQSMNPKGKRNVGGALPPFIQILLLFFSKWLVHYAFLIQLKDILN